MKPFGIELGKPLPKTVRYRGREYHPSDAVFAYEYKEVVPPATPEYDPAPSKPVKHPYGYRVFTTPVSRTVYRVDAQLPYANKRACKKAGENFAQFLVKKARRFEGDRWERRRLDGDFHFVTDMEIAVGVIEGMKMGAFDKKRPMLLRDVSRLAESRGVRVVVACGARRLFIIVQHLPSVELRIAEGYQNDKSLRALYASGKDGKPSPAFMIPFGVRLAKPLPKAVRTKRSPISDHPLMRKKFFYRINPPNPHRLFWAYEALVTPMTESLISLTALRAIKSRNECRESLGNVAKSFARSFGVAAPKWYRPARSDLEAKAALRLRGRGGLNVYVNFKCMHYETLGEYRSLISEFKVKQRRIPWFAIVQFVVPGDVGYDDLELSLMNPTVGTAWF